MSLFDAEEKETKKSCRELCPSDYNYCELKTNILESKRKVAKLIAIFMFSFCFFFSGGICIHIHYPKQSQRQEKQRYDFICSTYHSILLRIDFSVSLALKSTM